MHVSPTIPFADRLTCTVTEACKVSGLGRTKLYEAMADGRLAWTKVDNRRLIAVPSLLKMLAPAAAQVFHALLRKGEWKFPLLDDDTDGNER